MTKLLIALTFFAFSQNSFAIDFEDAIFPELATSGRALAMGNAFISKVDDSSAAFYNPAGLGTIRNTHFHISNFQLEMNRGVLSSGIGGKFTDAVGNMFNMFTLDGTRQILNKHVGTIAHSRFQMLPNLTTRYFSAGYLVAKRTRSVVEDETVTGFQYADRFDHGPYAALNISLFGGIIKAGASAVLLSRKEVVGSSDPATKLTIEDDMYKKGRAIISTGGVKLTLPVVFLPTFSATMHNALGAEFKFARGAGAPDTIKTSIDAGFSITPQLGTGSRIHFEINYKDLTREFANVSTKRRVLIGAELDLSRIFFFRLGYGDGFGSFGLGVKTKKLEFDLTTYAVDTTTNKMRGSEDRRFVLGLSSGF